MKRKFIAVSICIIFIMAVAPSTNAVETEIPDNDSWFLVHITATGTGRCITILGFFILGFGRCWLMIVDLEHDGHIEIRSIREPSDRIELDGSHRLVIIGFLGYRDKIDKININGIALSVTWS
jgi:hypothetical protein